MPLRISPRTMRRRATALMRRAGIDVKRARNTPFGVRWEDDVAALGEVRLAVDVGANEGQTVDLMLRAFPFAHIFSYEPVPRTFEGLRRRYGSARRVTCIQAAMGAQMGQVEMTDGVTSGQNTILIGAKPDETQVSVPVTTLAAETAQRGWHGIDLLKIDTEGYEMRVLVGALPLLRSGAVRCILVECDFVTRPHEPHGSFRDIFGLLDPLGYRVVAFYCGAVDGRGWIWGDVLFIREAESHPVLFTPYG